MVQQAGDMCSSSENKNCFSLHPPFKKDMMKKSKQIVEAEEDTVATINDDIKMDG